MVSNGMIVRLIEGRRTLILLKTACFAFALLVTLLSLQFGNLVTMVYPMVKNVVRIHVSVSPGPVW